MNYMFLRFFLEPVIVYYVPNFQVLFTMPEVSRSPYTFSNYVVLWIFAGVFNCLNGVCEIVFAVPLFNPRQIIASSELSIFFRSIDTLLFLVQ